MKVIASIVLVLAVSSHASIIPLAIGSPALTTIQTAGGTLIAASSLGIQHIPAQHTVSASPGALHITASPSLIPHSIATPLIVRPAPIAYAPLAIVQPQGQYVAANRGTVHVSELPGHTDSAVALNLQPAPGTL